MITWLCVPTLAGEISVDEAITEGQTDSVISISDEIENTVISSANDAILASDTKADGNTVSGDSTTSENTVSSNVWDLLRYSGKEPVPMKASDGKYYIAKGAKFNAGTGGGNIF